MLGLSVTSIDYKENPEHRLGQLVYRIKGRRDYQEDRYDLSFNDDNSFLHIGVFDGHGGHFVSTYLQDNFINLIKKERIINETTVQKTINRIETDLKKNHLADSRTTGSTFIYAGFNFEQGLLHIANIGDSRIIGCQGERALDLTRDHKPDDPLEKKRIESLGYKIEYDKSDKIWRVDGYALSRAVGDLDAVPLSAIVEFDEYPIAQYDYIVLASDGLWDVMSSQEVVTFINQYYRSIVDISIHQISKQLCKKAYELGSWDNITVVIVPLSER